MAKKIPYACPAAIANGMARCQNRVPCRDHPKGSPPAPRPTVVLLKFNLDRKWSKEFRRAGIHRGTSVPLEPEAARGRGAAHLPGRADTGCLVFGTIGPDADIGPRNVDLSRIPLELSHAGFRLTAAYQFPRYKSYRNGGKLVLEFSTNLEPGIRAWFPLELFPWKLLQELTSQPWGEVFVWANEVKPDRNCPHTVNATQRFRGRPSNPLTLRFASGLWEAVRD